MDDTGTATAAAGRIEYLVAAESTRIWFEHFLLDVDRGHVRFTGEHDGLACGIEDLGPRSTDLVVLYSSHETLARDLRTADALRRRGLNVLCQSSTAARLGTDKFAMKRFFELAGFASPPWRCDPHRWPSGSDGGLVVVKSRHGTQSNGMRLSRTSECQLEPDEFAETYLDGVEYSVLCYRDRTRCVLFPPVWKGRNGTDLRPPWRRVRRCPAEEIDGRLAETLAETTRRLAHATDCMGYLEAEFLVAGDEVLLLEINPRISGIMRITALATGVPIFSLPARPDIDGTVPTTRFAAEAPYRGTPYVDPNVGIYATSRLTVAADTVEDMRALFRRVHGTDSDPR